MQRIHAVGKDITVAESEPGNPDVAVYDFRADQGKRALSLFPLPPGDVVARLDQEARWTAISEEGAVTWKYTLTFADEYIELSATAEVNGAVVSRTRLSNSEGTD